MVLKFICENCEKDATRVARYENGEGFAVCDNCQPKHPSKTDHKGGPKMIVPLGGARAELLDSDGEVVNVVQLDPTMFWDPPEGHTVRVLAEHEHSRKWDERRRREQESAQAEG